ncbi:hypothetical protein CYMTET_23229 [Cymbomonas tetramitiformis]|uniref:Chromo domain-containing protein n=1 Tax=Cymbomonas tetramitiformis TaxID=36881 RepID=A0AAE0FYL5_9CHLO|nr:hypothetical protein CYMTET_23229 [Cymbomonas tetramitiformis]
MQQLQLQLQFQLQLQLLRETLRVDGEPVFAAADTDTTMEDPEVTAARDQMREDFSDIFQEDLPAGHRPERFEGGYHRINIEPGHKPPSQPVRTIPVPMMEELKRQIIKYVELGILRPSSSPYGCPIIFAPKPGGKWRMCCDYRAHIHIIVINITIKDTYPLPPHDTLLEQLKGARWFSRFDFNQFFHQIPIHPDDIHKTAIRTRYGSYEWTVMPFGLTNAPATALRVGNRAFFDFIDRFLVNFMDDTIVYSLDFDSHVKHVRQFLQRCRDHQFFIRPSKVELFVRSIDFIGHHISEAGLSIIEDRIRAVMAIQPPVSYDPTVGKQPLRRMAKDGKSSLRSFLGMVGQFRRFIPKFSKIAEPLNRLLKDNAEFVWESEQQKAFDNLKSAICNAPVLQLPDQKLPSIMEVDGSGTHVGQVVLQDQGKANSWEDKLPLVEFAINNTVSATTGYSPFYLDSKAQPLSPHDLAITIPPEAPVPVQNAIRDHFDQYSAVHANAVDNISRAAEISQARFNKTHMPRQYAVGQKVLLRTEFIQWTGLTEAGRHFKQPYIGPFTISKVLSHGRAYELDFGDLDIRIHPVQPVSRIELYNDSIQAPLPLPQMITEEGQPLFEISHILSDKITRGVKYYLVRYAGYGPEHDTWVKATELTNAADMIAAYEG